MDGSKSTPAQPTEWADKPDARPGFRILKPCEQSKAVAVVSGIIRGSAPLYLQAIRVFLLSLFSSLSWWRRVSSPLSRSVSDSLPTG